MPAQSDTGVRLIGGFKLVKALLLVGVAIVAFDLVHRDHVDELVRWTSRVGIDPSARILRSACAKVAGVDDRSLELAGAGALVYGAVFGVEGVGLLARKSWAEWMTLGVTTSFLPFELYELAHGVTAGRVAAVVINVLVLVYLAARMWRRAHERRGRRVGQNSASRSPA